MFDAIYHPNVIMLSTNIKRSLKYFALNNILKFIDKNYMLVSWAKADI